MNIYGKFLAKAMYTTSMHYGGVDCLASNNIQQLEIEEYEKRYPKGTVHGEKLLW
jgi:hypothetical protein